MKYFQIETKHGSIVLLDMDCFKAYEKALNMGIKALSVIYLPQFGKDIV